MKEIAIGILAAFFFGFTFIFNHSMELEGGSWLWSASLRYFFMLPFLIAIVWMRGGFRPLMEEVRRAPASWLGWSFVGFALFYAPLTFAAAFGPGWLVSATWQFTIVAGVLLAPFFLTSDGKRQRTPLVSLAISGVILAGIILIQVPQAGTASMQTILLGALPVVLAAFAYPLGNRKMMEVCDGRLDTFQRVLGMTIASMPAWIVMAIWALATVGPPTGSQVIQCLLVAVSSGVIATTLFFIATDRSRGNQGRLAAVEATQSTEVLFVMAGEMLLLGVAMPSSIALSGVGVIIAGMLLHSYHTMRVSRRMHLEDC